VKSSLIHGPCTRLLFTPTRLRLTASIRQPHLSTRPLPPTLAISNLLIYIPPSYTSRPHLQPPSAIATPSRRATSLTRHDKSKMTSRIPNPSAPRLSTAPSSIKPRQLVRSLLFLPPFPLPLSLSSLSSPTPTPRSSPLINYQRLTNNFSHIYTPNSPPSPPTSPISRTCYG
jgi:hypothetical protein